MITLQEVFAALKPQAQAQAFCGKFAANICGHRTPESRELLIGGKLFNIKIPLSENGIPDYCFKCHEDNAILCAWCGEHILIGDFVTLYSANPKLFIPAKSSVIYNDDPMQLIGCVREECIYSCSDLAGQWVVNRHGKCEVLRLRSPMEKSIHEDIVFERRYPYVTQ